MIKNLISILQKVNKGYKVDAKDGMVYIGFGEDLLTGERGKIYWEKPSKQGIVFGASGSGKSEFVARKTYEDILTGFQSFNVDPKGSENWLKAFLTACYRKGVLHSKENGPLLLMLPYPEISIKFNPLFGLTPHQIAYVVASGIPESKEPFWWQISYEITLVCALALTAKGVKEITFEDLYNYLSIDKLEELKAKVLTDTTYSEYKEEAIKTLEKLTTYDARYFSEINASLRTYLTRLITGETGRILNVKLGRNILEERLEKGNLLFFAFLNSEAMKQVAYDVARLLFAWLLTYVGKQSAKLKKIEPQLRVNIDELTEVGFHEVNKAIRLVRERNVSVLLLTQSPSGLKSAFKSQGDAIVKDIINSCDLRIFFKMNEPEDCSYVSEMSPEVEKPRAIIHKNSISITYQKVPLVEPFELQALKPGYGYAFLDGTVYYFYSPLYKDSLKVEIIFQDEKKKTKADLVVKLKDLYALVEDYFSKNYSDCNDITCKIEEGFKKKKFSSDEERIQFLSKILEEEGIKVSLEGLDLENQITELAKAVLRIRKRSFKDEDLIVFIREFFPKLGFSKERITDISQKLIGELKAKKEKEFTEDKAGEGGDKRENNTNNTNEEIKQKILKRLLGSVCKNQNVLYEEGKIFVSSAYLKSLLKYVVEKDIKDEDLKNLLDAKEVKVKIYMGNKLIREGLFFRVDYFDPKLENIKKRSPYGKWKIVEEES